MIVGIDPGLDGAIAVLYNTGELVTVSDMPTITTVVGGKRRRRIDIHGLDRHLGYRWPSDLHVIVEKVSTRPGLSATSVLSTGYGAGLIEGILVARNIPHTFVRPQEWQRAAGVTADKAFHVLRCHQLWPDQADQFPTSKDGRADAALIAWWWTRGGHQ